MRQATGDNALVLCLQTRLEFISSSGRNVILKEESRRRRYGRRCRLQRRAVRFA